MNKLILVLGFSLLTSASFAQSQADVEGMSDAESLWLAQCGSAEELKVLTGGKPLSKADKKELNEMRAPVQKVLNNGEAGIKEVLEEGSKQDTGAFGAIMVCSLLNSMKPLIAQKGCVPNLSSNQKVYDGPGFAACEKLMANLPK
jgi:hypothetical protein